MYQVLDVHLSARMQLVGGVVVHVLKLVPRIQQDTQVGLFGVLYEVVRDGTEEYVHVQHVILTLTSFLHAYPDE